MTITRQEAVERCAEKIAEEMVYHGYNAETRRRFMASNMESATHYAIITITALESAGLLHWPEQEK